MIYDALLALYATLTGFLFIYAIHAWLMIFYEIKFGSKKDNRPKRYYNDKNLPDVCVQLPVYNEGSVAVELIESAVKLDYPKEKLEIQVLDDSTDQTTNKLRLAVEKYKELGFNIKLFHRTNREGFKAGALNEALAKTKAEFIAIFDADFRPKSDFLKKTIHYFTDENIAVVQTRWGHINYNHSILTRLQAILLDTHFMIEQRLKNRAGHLITFNGTAGIWRKSKVIKAGGWDGTILAEDIDLSYRTQINGDKIVFLPEVEAPSQLPIDINGFKNQQYRWTKGTIQAAKKLLKHVWHSRLNLVSKFEATIQLTAHLVYPFLFLISLLAFPMLMIKQTGIDYRSYFAVMSIFLLGALPYPILYIISQKRLYKDWIKRSLYVPFVMAAIPALSLNNLLAVLDGFYGKGGIFVRTPKYDLKTGEKHYIVKFKPTTFVEFLIGIYLVISSIYAIATTQFSIIPFLLLFTIGFMHISLSAVSQEIKRMRAAQEINYIVKEET